MKPPLKLKPLQFRGSSKKDFLGFPENVRVDGGHQLYLIQKGETADDWKPITTVGRGCYEIRIDEDANAYRIIYVAKFENAIYVLHAFQKTTRKTSQSDIDLARDRYAMLVKELR